VPKCFSYQEDHWRGSVIQSDQSTVVYEFIGHYFFDKATEDGGVWRTVTVGSSTRTLDRNVIRARANPPTGPLALLTRRQILGRVSTVALSALVACRLSGRAPRARPRRLTRRSPT
jgi:hypothetical protein